jgi:outer membrane protein OmpA-like peptidoglycan-associated protein
MRCSYLFALVILLGAGITLTGCGSKTAKSGPGTDVEQQKGLTPDFAPAEWAYDQAPTPAIQGSPDFRLVSFGFDRDGALLKSEAKGACREAMSKLADKSAVRLVVIGFADGIHEKPNAVALGMRRAHAARQFLSTLGIPPENIQATSFGATYSTARDFETIQQSYDRKVEVWVVR